ncbi:hypothetical protein [Roseibium sp.]|uniref:hypothetical protein n=1 Tax=Roseibium sp. TaxID=1936156 RepID=UPI003A987F48
MPPLTPPPKIKLSRLRDIGWSLWDPIGLLDTGKSWEDDDCRPFADEYDSYLIEAAGKLRRGVPDADVATFLVKIEAEHMGLRERSDTYERAQSVVAAIHADDKLWTYPDR